MTHHAILKIQVPYACTGEPMALVYNEDRSFECQLPVDQVADAMEGDLKRYFDCDIIDAANGVFQILLHVEDQPW